MKSSLVKAIQNELDSGYDGFMIGDTFYLAWNNPYADTEYLLCDSVIIGIVQDNTFIPVDERTPWNKLSEEKRRSIKDYRYKGFEPFCIIDEFVLSQMVDADFNGNIMEHLIEKNGFRAAYSKMKMCIQCKGTTQIARYELHDAEGGFVCNLKKVEK